MAVHAPFRFSPINRWVYFPEWAELVTHDVPFADGICGEIEIEIEAKTPLVVGGPRRKPTSEQVGEVWPFAFVDENGTQTPRYAIPGSSLTGMVRSILEIAAFGKLGPWVDERRYGIRDLTEGAKPFYRDRLIDKVKAGFMRNENGRWIVRPYDLKRIEFRRIPCRENARPNFGRRTLATERYGWLQSTGPYRHTEIGAESSVSADPAGTAWVVVTGNTGVGGEKAKKREFIFIERSELPIEVPKDVQEDFRYIHEGGDGTDESKWNETWRHFWKNGYPKGGPPQSFKRGGEIPVFYILSEGRIASIGLAYMFKLAHEKSTHELLANSAADHASARVDLPSLIFGFAADDMSVGLKRRASFDTAIANLPEGKGIARTVHPTVLLSPKPSYYPVYVRQPRGDRADQLPAGEPYATYTPYNGTQRPAHLKPELSGVKIWPARPDAAASTFPNLRPAPAGAGSGVQLHLNALPAGTRFVTRMRLHNIRPIELGAIVWALSFGDRDAIGRSPTRYRHRLGLGKPYGLGLVSISLKAFRLKANNNRSAPSALELLKAFEGHMEAASTKSPTPAKWSERPQYLALLKAANPDANVAEVLNYMDLGDSRVRSEGTYIDERRSRRFMPAYVAEPREDTPTQPRGGSTGAPRRAPPIPPPQPARDPVIGDKAKVGERVGTIVELPKDARSPVWRIDFGDGRKAQPFRRQFFVIVS